MIIVMRIGAPEEEVDAIVKQIESSGATAHIDHGSERTIIGIRSARHDLDESMFRLLPGVEDVKRISKRNNFV